MRLRSLTLRSSKGKTICGRCFIADNPLSRLRGLLGCSGLDDDEGLLLTPAAGIHTSFMRFPIDAVFLDFDMTVLGMRENLKPWRVAGVRGARSVLELPAGRCKDLGLSPGDRLTLHERTDETARVMLVLDQDGDSTLVFGEGPISAAARTVSAMRDLDVGVSAILVHEDERPPTENTAA